MAPEWPETIEKEEINISKTDESWIQIGGSEVTSKLVDEIENHAQSSRTYQ